MNGLMRRRQLLLALVALILPRADGCQETAWRNGRLDPDLGSFTISSGGSCTCCALCHQNPACASLGFSTSTGECQLYGSVAGYDTLIKDPSWTYFVMPRRSQHHEFCREDSDCLVQGDFCRGRVCTDRSAVTCRTIYETFGAGQRFGGYIGGMFGWLNGTSATLACRMSDTHPGYTRLMWSVAGTPFDQQTLRRYNTELTDGVDGHSMLYLAEHVRQAGTETTYNLQVLYDSQYYITVNYDVPRDEPVLSDVPRPGVGVPATSSNFISFSWTTCMPYLPASGSALLTTNADSVEQGNGAIARTDGAITWGRYSLTSFLVYIRE